MLALYVLVVVVLVAFVVDVILAVLLYRTHAAMRADQRLRARHWTAIRPPDDRR